jgi:hypothetical protein
MVDAALRAAPGSHLSLGLGLTHNHVRLPGGDFDSDVASLRFSYAFSTRLVAQAYVQYNRLEKRLLVNGRVQLIHAPGSDLYLVWSEERGSESEGSVRPLVNRTLAVKLSRLIRF